jgi:hypothetical protein
MMASVRDVPEGQGMSGHELYELPDDPHTYERRMGSSTTAVPLTVFCPSCSDIVQYDRRINAVVPKWSLRSSDFVFNIEYGEDDTGSFARCGACGHDLRKEVKGLAAKTQPKVRRKVRKDVTLNCPPEMMKGGRYHNGYFICSVDEFKRVAKKGHEVASGISPAVEFGGTTYAISLSKFITFWKEMEVDGERMVGVPRIYWKEV